MNYIDLFSGAGGLSEGFVNAGFKPIVHIEVDKKACETLRTRSIYHKLKELNKLGFYNDYLRDNLSREKFLEQFEDEQIKSSILNCEIGKDNRRIFTAIDQLAKGKSIDLIIGGPPCQAYSLVGRSRDKNRMKGDPRNFLYKEYAKFLKRYNPKLFVFENVRGLVTANNGEHFRDMHKHFEKAGFKLHYKVLNASDYGVLQNRKRIILIGWRKDIDFSYPDFEKVEHEWTVKDILNDLKVLKPGEQENITKYRSVKTSYLETFELRNGVDFVTQHIARPHNSRDLKIYTIAIKKWLSNQERLKYPDLPQKLKTHKNEKSFIDRFKVVDPNGYSHTMVAHIAKDGHHYIYPDLDQIRSLSVREAARVQSFPDDYFFEGSRGAAFRQIGNAVPPLMAYEIAKTIKQSLCPKTN